MPIQFKKREALPIFLGHCLTITAENILIDVNFLVSERVSLENSELKLQLALTVRIIAISISPAARNHYQADRRRTSSASVRNSNVIV